MGLRTAKNHCLIFWSVWSHGLHCHQIFDRSFFVQEAFYSQIYQSPQILVQILSQGQAECLDHIFHY